MISGPPPGRISRLFSAWADWLFHKLSPPQPSRTQRTQPPKLVTSDRGVREDRGAREADAPATRDPKRASLRSGTR